MKPSSYPMTTAVTLVGFQLLALALLVAGWIANIYKLSTYAESTGKTALRIIGVFIGPIGGVVGWF